MKRAVARLIKECADKAEVYLEDMYDSGKHIKVLVCAKKRGVVFVSASASDHRAFLNVITDMRRVTRD